MVSDALELPDAPGYDWPTLHACWVPGDPYQPEAETPAYYAAKARVAHWLQPRRVVEIGVRAGYSARAFHLGHPFAQFVGFDLDAGGWGGVAGYAAYARALLGAIPGLAAEVIVADSQALRELPPHARGADLFHVDGDHTPHGCAHDILLALHNGARWILVDDYDYTTHVREGADWVVRRKGLQAWRVEDGGYRGNLLIRGHG